ncbi:MAG: hypothetical protein AB8E82_17705 [Aureispira sp.]
MIESPFVEIINYKGKQIIYWSFPDGIQQKVLISTLKMSIDFMRKNKQFKYVLSDYSNIPIGNEIMQLLKSNAAVFDNVKSAVLGVTGLKKFLLWGYNQVAKKQVLAFDTKEEALEYLVKD